MDFFIGDPEFQADFHEYQDTDYSCAVAAQVSIINQFSAVSGFEGITEDEALYMAHENGWITEAGTSPTDMGRLIEAAGIPVHEVYNASIADLEQELQLGHRVVISVNSSELWDAEDPLAQFFNWLREAFGLDSSEFSPADHAVVVTGIDAHADPPTVFICDSGKPDGAALEYPLDDFMDAWDNSDFHYVATDFSPDQFAAMQAPAGSESWVDEAVGVGTGVAAFCLTGDPILALTAGFRADSVAERIMESPDPALTALSVGYDIYTSVPTDVWEAMWDDLLVTA